MAPKDKKSYKKKPKMTVQDVEKIVKTQISRNIENKTIQWYGTKNIYPSISPGWDTSNIFPLTPYSGVLQIAQGASQGQRIGNAIKIKKLIFSGIFTPLAQQAVNNPTPKPQYVILWLVHDRLNPVTNPQVTSNSFIQNGGSSSNLTNTLQDVYAPINNDRWKLYKKKVYKLGFENQGGSSAPTTLFANNDFKLSQRMNIDITDYIVQNVKFNDNNTDPITRGLYCVVTTVSAVPTVNDNTDIPVQGWFRLHCVYEDA
jgi:hypothetical protein